MNSKPTAKQIREGNWEFQATMRNCGSDIIWAEQRDTKTGARRWVRATNSQWGDSTSGKTIIRYQTPRA